MAKTSRPAGDNIISLQFAHDTSKNHKAPVWRQGVLWQSIVLLVCVAVMITLGLQIAKNLQTASRLDQEIQAAQEVQQLAQDQQSRLEEEVRLLQDDEYVAKLARSEYYLSKSGEIIFSTPSDTAQSRAQEAREERAQEEGITNQESN